MKSSSENSSLETKLGMFFIVAVLASFIILQLIGATDFFKSYYEIHGRFNTAQELKTGDPVKMAGVQVGKVQQIDIAGEKVNVSMKIEKKYAVKTDSKATIKFAGLLGQNFVSLTIGSTAAPQVTAGAEIQTTEQPDLSTLMAKLENVATGVENVTKSFSGDTIQNVLGPFTDFLKQNSPRLTAIFGNMQIISEQIAQGKGTVGKLISDEALYNSAMSAVKNLNDTAGDVKGLIGDAKGMMGDAKAALAEAKGALTEARTVVVGINEGKGSVGRLVKDEKLYQETTDAMVNLREILQKINQGQGTAGKFVNDETFFKNAKMTLQKVDKATEGLEDQGPLSVLGIMVNGLF